MNEHPWATTEASDGSRPPWSAAAIGRFFCRQRLGGYGSRRLLDGLAPLRRPTRAAATGYSGRTSERSRVVVVGRVTFEMQGDKNWACGGLDCFRSVAGGLRCAKDLRRPRYGCSGGLSSRNGGFSPLNEPTTWDQFAWPALVT